MHMINHIISYFVVKPNLYILKMAKFSVISFIALLVCLVIVTVTANGWTDESGKPCPMCAVPLIYAPVCGTNGQTYSNWQTLECHKNCLKSNLAVKYEGEC